jgi:hypothetical protein
MAVCSHGSAAHAIERPVVPADRYCRLCRIDRAEQTRDKELVAERQAGWQREAEGFLVWLQPAGRRWAWLQACRWRRVGGAGDFCSEARHRNPSPSPWRDWLVERVAPSANRLTLDDGQWTLNQSGSPARASRDPSARRNGQEAVKTHQPARTRTHDR